MRVFITGGSGFVGQALCLGLRDQGHEVTVLCRTKKSAQRLPPNVTPCIGDPTSSGHWQQVAAEHDGFINLAGASIFGRWNKAYKALLRSSRLETTKNLVQAMGLRKTETPAVLVSASAVGYYGFCADEELDESSPPGHDFLARLCRDWEQEALAAEGLGARVVRARFGIVLDKGGGALDQMMPIFKMGLGGPLGSGRQWFSWIHRADLVSALIFLLNTPQVSGAVNCTAPNPVTNKQLAKELGRALRRPAFLPAPGLVIKAVMGEFGSVLLQGQRALPRALLAADFSFGLPELPQALADILKTT